MPYLFSITAPLYSEHHRAAAWRGWSVGYLARNAVAEQDLIPI